MSNSDVLLEERGHASWVWINRPAVHNAVDGATLSLLREAFHEAERRPSAAIVLSGVGGRAFSAGGDLEELAAAGAAEARVFLRRLADLLRAMRASPKPVIARVDGFCFGGGNELALAADLIAASDRSVFGQLGPAVGAATVLGATQILPRVVGEKKAREIVFLAERYTAEEAERMGWVNKVVPAADLDPLVLGWAERMAALSPQSLRISKLSLNAGLEGESAAMEHGLELLAQAFDSAELKEGMSAFLEKRRPDFARFRR